MRGAVVGMIVLVPVPEVLKVVVRLAAPLMYHIRLVCLIAATLSCFAHSRTILKTSPELSKRAIELDGSCNNFPQVSQGLSDSRALANNAVNVLNGANPFVDGHPWDALRQTLFGPEDLSSTQDITSKP